MAAFFLNAQGKYWAEEGTVRTEDNKEQYCPTVMGNWKLIGCMCHVQKCQHEKISYCKM